ncbi:Retrovirus-related Pol polyprotein from transposon [Smittium culicis]|uniref:Retrovirus-related Pol polyprotein from transposon n=1 Tax=Smittium culicis TaxID=133412 RepID=A0A1R1XUX5_9FUNG|nr:Retrovirus-related Pol polyprotein from transposon [Smittium culicis]
MERKTKPDSTSKLETTKHSSVNEMYQPNYPDPNAYLQHLIPNVGPTNLFSGSEVEEFLELYDVITKGLKDERKVKFFPRYCVPSLVDQIKWTEEYEDGNWGNFCAMLKKRYKKKRKSDPFKEIEKLVSKGIKPENTETFFQNFDFLTNKLIKEDYITKRQKTEYLLKSLPEGLLEKLSCEIIQEGDFKPYKELSDIISNHLQSENTMEIFKKNSFKNQEPKVDNKAIAENLNAMDSNLSKEKEEVKPIFAVKDNHSIKSTDKDIVDLVKQMGAMVLKLDKSIDVIKENRQNKFANFERVIRCIYCDGQHSKRDCKELVEDINSGLVKLDDKKNVLLSSGKQLLPNYGNGGMKAQVRDIYKSVSNNLITVKNENEEDAYDYSFYPGYSSNFDDEVNTFEVVSEVEFEKILNSFAVKRKDEDIPLSEKVKMMKTADTINNENEISVIENKTNENYEEPSYNLKAKIVNSDLKDNVLKKCKEALVTISLEEVASISPFVRKTLNDDFRLRREVKVDQFQKNDSYESSDNWKKKYLSVGSGRTKGMVQGVKMLLMFDEGSEVNIMSEAVYNGLKNLNRADLDSSIQWKMRDANSGSSNLLGVVKDCEIEIDGVKIKTHIFVSSTLKTPLILGRPWDIKSRAVKENKADGSLWYTIMDESSDKKSSFCVSKVDDSRRYEDKSNKDRNDFEIENFKIDLIKSVKDWGYEPLVYTRYKSAKEKVKPVSIALDNIESPSIQKKDMEKKIISNRLTEERISKMIIGDGNLSLEEIEFFKIELKKNEEAFAYHPDEMGLLSTSIEDPVYVETVEHTPWQVAPYPIPRGIVEKVKGLLKDKLVKGILEPTNGPYSNNWFCVQKKSGGLRFIQDVQKVNAVTKKNAGKPPFVDTFAEEFSGCKIYTTFDLMSGYDQISLDKRSRDLFSLQTPLGLLRMTRLPQGWTNSVQIFQRLMTKVFIKHIPNTLGIFIDDGCIKGVKSGGDELVLPGIRKFVYDHIIEVADVLKTMINSGLTVNGDKCRFGVQSAKLVGFLCNKDGRLPISEKTEIIKQFPIPKTLKQLRGFLGMCGFYRLWIDNYSTIAEPLFRLTKKESKFIINYEQLKAIEILKNKLTSPPILRPPEYGENSGKIYLTVDASPVGAGAVLSQEDENGIRRKTIVKHGE